MPLARCLLAAALALARVPAGAEVRVTDDAGRAVTLKAPAQRIISLAPHLTELLFAAGAGKQAIGTVEFSDYPEGARAVARVGDSALLDLERIVELRPDLILVWQHGNAQRQLDKLLSLGIPVFYDQPNRLSDIPRSIERLGRLAGTEVVATSVARAFRAREADLRKRYAGRAPVRVFYQIWEQPLMTINDEHLISDVIRLCGGHNVMADLKQLAPVISTEAVLAADPEVIAGATAEPNMRDDLDNWKTWPRILAVKRDNLFVIHTDLISRHTPRVLDGAQQMCENLDKARAKRRR
ncbi:MAG: cobalamin-binding protein [Betaproteobacteria bacterium]|nr:MAG: cobalamin-binding protein [Betaproteobacteria bacterium]